MKKHMLVALATIIGLVTVYNILPQKIDLNHDSQIVFEDASLKVKKIGTYDKLSVLFVKNNVAYGIEDHFVYKSVDNGKSFVQLGSLPKHKPTLMENIKNTIARLRIVRDFRRNKGPVVLTVLDSGTIIVIYDKIYRSEDGGKSFEVINYPARDFQIPYFNNIAVSPSGNIYAGEYTTKKRPHVVRVLEGANDGRDWIVKYTFPKGEIFHVHGIFWSHLLDSIIVATGDLNAESKLLKTNDEFETLQSIGEGDQGWRAVSLSESNNSLFWGSDNDRTGAYLYQLADGKRTRHAFTGKVSYDSNVILPSTLVVSETLEPVSEYIKSSDEGFQISAWLSPDGQEWVEAIKFELSNRDQLLKTKKRPRLMLPNGDGSINKLFISPQFTKSPQGCLEPCTIAYEIEWK